MTRPKGVQASRPHAADDPVTDFAARLRELRAQAGSPSFRQLAKVTHYSSSALAEATRGKRLPSEAVLRAFVTGCGAQPDEWVSLLNRAAAQNAAAQAAARTAATGPPVRRAAFPGNPRRLAVIAAGACALLAAGVLLGTAIPDPRPVPTGKTKSATSAKTGARRPADGTDPVVAGCVKDARLVDKSPVMLHGQQIGALEMIYSARCAAAWARIYLYPGQPSMLGRVTIQASDGRLASFAHPLVKQVAVYTDVLRNSSSECLAASATFRSAQVPARAAISCQNPAS